MEEKETRVSPEDVQQDVPPAEEPKADEALSDALSKALEAEAAAEARAKELEDKAPASKKSWRWPSGSMTACRAILTISAAAPEMNRPKRRTK